MDSTVRVMFLGNASSAVRSVRQLEGSFGGLGRAASTAGKLLAVGVVGGLAAAVKAAVQYDRAMRNVNTIAKLNETQFKALSKQVLGLAKATGQGPKTLAAGLYDIVSSGFKAADGLKILRASAKAATAGLTDTATSTKAVVAVLNAYHQGAEQATHVSDVLFETVNKGVLTFEELASQIGDVLPVAAQLGVPLEDIGGALATITLHGVSAAEASTQLKQLLVSILKPSEDLKKSIHDMGFETGETALKTLGLEGFLQRLSTAAHGSGAAFANWFPNVRAMNGALGLTGKNIATLHQNLQAMRSSQGATQAAFAEQGKSIAFQWQRAKASLTAAAIPIGQLLFPLLAKAADKVGEFAQSIQTHMPQIRAAFSDIDGVVGGIAHELGSLAGTSGGQSALVTLIATLATAKTITGTKNMLAGIAGAMKGMGLAGTIAAVGIGVLAGAWYLATQQGNRFAGQIRDIQAAINKQKAAVATHAQALDNLAQAQINASTTARQASGAETLYNRAVRESGKGSDTAKSALDNLKQAKLNAKNASEDLAKAEELERSTRVKATQATRATAQAQADFTSKAEGARKKYAGLVAEMDHLAAVGSTAADSQRRLSLQLLRDQIVRDYASAMETLARKLGVGAGKASDYASAVYQLNGQLGRLPSLKEVRILIHQTTITSTTGNIQRPGAQVDVKPNRAAGGMIPGATGEAVPVKAHAGEMILNPAQQMVLGGPRFLSGLFGFTGSRGAGASFAGGGIIGPGGQPTYPGPRRPPDVPRIKRSKSSPHRPLHSRAIRTANARVKKALAGLADIDTKEQIEDRVYGQMARDFDITQEQFLVDAQAQQLDENGQGVVDKNGKPIMETIQVVDTAAVAQRLGEIDSLVSERGKMLGLLDEEKARLTKAVATLRAAVKDLLSAIKAEQEAAKKDEAEVKRLTAEIATRNQRIEADRKTIRSNQQAIAEDHRKVSAERAKGKKANKSVISGLEGDIGRRQEQNRSLQGTVHNLLVDNQHDRSSRTAHSKSATAHHSQAAKLTREVADWQQALTDTISNQQNTLPYDRRDVELDMKELLAERAGISATTAPPRQVTTSGDSSGAGSESGGSGGEGNQELVAELMRQLGAARLALGIQAVQLPILGSYARGTLSVPVTGPYELHAGEQVVPRSQVRGSSDGRQPVQVNVIVDDAMGWLKPFIRAEAADVAGEAATVYIGSEADRRRREGRA